MSGAIWAGRAPRWGHLAFVSTRGLCVLLFALLLGACATRPPAAPGENRWDGRLAVRIDSTPPQSFSAGFELKGSPDAGELRFTSPLGNTLATVLWTPIGAELRQGTDVRNYQNLDALTAELSGTALPVAALFSWLQGQPQQAAGWQADLALQPEGRVTALRELPEPRAELRIVFQP
ncbi:outer membrane lipoprotein LolB [Hydrogenophaga sp.]|uniref:outer membrane lipoprotein LolB n=1 Tax=Hydrogenophaga sp. TaxID=1904254 RepID=UPI003565A980